MTSATDAHNDTDSKRIRWTQYQGMSILIMDFSHASPAETLAMIDEFPGAIKGQEPGSVRMLTDLTEAAYDPAISSKWKAVRVQHDAQIRASAVYGISGLVGVAVRSFVELMELLSLPRAKKKLRIFKNKEQALAWLVKA